MTTTELYAKAAELAGRPVEVEQTTDGKWIVLWMHFQASPPPKGDSEDAALQGFIDMMLQRKGADANLPEVDTDKEESRGEHTGTDSTSESEHDRRN